MLAKLLRLLGLLAYAVVVLTVFVATGYVSFNLFVRSGVTTVPELIGLTESEARARLSDNGLELRLAEDARRYDESVPADHVLQHDPEAGDLVKRGSSVEAVLSLGPELIEVPDLRGQALQAAQVTLAGSGLVLGRTASVFSSAGQAGTVVEQHPSPGSRVGRVTPVELFLCLEGRSETFVMPDLIYRDYEAVRRFFDRREFRLGSVKFEVYEGISPGIILRQYPLPGHPLRRRDVISLVVATSGRTGA